MPTPQAYPAQTNQFTCGIAALAACQARVDEASGGILSNYQTFTAEQVKAVQKELHRDASWTGIPWPRFLGTSPWALAKMASRRTGVKYRLRVWSAKTAQAAVLANAHGYDVFVYVGGRVVPRHVVLMLAGEGAQMRIFEPGSGQVLSVPRCLGWQKWTGKKPQKHWGWWTRPLLAVVPVVA